MEASNKDMTRDVVRRIERIESQGHKTSSDREMLQALNARLSVCDQQQMRLTELRDLDRETNGGKHPEKAARFMEEHLPLGGQPRRPSISPQSRTTEHLRPSGERDARSTSPGPILDRADSKATSPSGSRERGKVEEVPYRTASQSSRTSRTPASPAMPFGAPSAPSQPPLRPFGIQRAATDSLDGPPRRPSPQLPPTPPGAPATIGTPLHPTQGPPHATVTARAMREVGDDQSSRRHTIFSPPPPPPPIDTVTSRSNPAVAKPPVGANRAFSDSVEDISGRRHSTFMSAPSAPPIEPVNLSRSANDSPRPAFGTPNWSRADNASCPPIHTNQSAPNQPLPYQSRPGYASAGHSVSAQSPQAQPPPFQSLPNPSLQNIANTAGTPGTPIEYPAVPPSLTSSRPSERFYDKYFQSISQNAPKPAGDPRGSSDNVSQPQQRRSSQYSQTTPKYTEHHRNAVNVPRPPPSEPILERQSPPRHSPPRPGMAINGAASSRASSEFSLPPSRPRSSTKRSYEAPYVRDALDDDTELEPDRSAWPLLYRILDVDPATDPSSFDATARR